MVISLRMSIWNNNAVLSILIILIMFTNLRKFYLVWSKLLGVGSTASSIFFYLMVLCVAMLTPSCWSSALVHTSWFSFFMWMTSRWLAVPLHFYTPLCPLHITGLLEGFGGPSLLSCYIGSMWFQKVFFVHSRNMLILFFISFTFMLLSLLVLLVLPTPFYPWLMVNCLQMLMSTKVW